MSFRHGDGDWQTSGNIERLRELWKDTSISTAEIGARLGVSKNAIVGKAGRLDLPKRPNRNGAVDGPRERKSDKELRRLAKPLPEDVVENLPPLPRVAPQASRPVIGSDTERSNAVLLGVAARDNKPTLPPLLSDPDGTLRTALTPPRTASALVRHLIPPPVPVPQPTPVARRDGPQCCWPIGEPGSKSFRFCDGSAVTGRPYCDEHCRLAFVRIRDRRDDAGEPAHASGGDD